MKSIKNILFISLFTCLVNSISAQDVRFSQLMNHPSRINPALLGINNELKATAAYRTQWSSVDKGYSVAAFGVAYPIFFKQEKWKSNKGYSKLDLGLHFVNDKAGAFNNNDVQLSVCQSLRLSSTTFMSLGVAGSFVQKSLTTDNLSFDEQYIWGSYDATLANGEIVMNKTKSYPDISFGIVWLFAPEDKKISAFAGIAGYHMNQPNESFIDNPNGRIAKKTTYTVGLKIKGEQKTDFYPLINFIQQGTLQTYNIGVKGVYHLNNNMSINIGGWYLNSSNVAIQLGLDHKSFGFAYCYEMPGNDITTSIPGLVTHEMSLFYRLPIADKNQINAGLRLY